MTRVAQHLLFVNDESWLVEPGHRWDATELPPIQVATLVAGMATQCAVDVNSDASRLLAARAVGAYLDYASDAALEVDRQIMNDYIKATPSPATEQSLDGVRRWLPHPACGALEGPLGRLGMFMLHGFGVLRTAEFLDVGVVPLKSTPSKGARHPFDAHLVAGPGAALPAGIYDYSPSDHALVRRDGEVPSDGLVLVVTLVYERVQWRYRETSGYCDLWLDLGHLRETLAAVATDLSCSVYPINLLSWPTVTSLHEEVVIAWRIDLDGAEG